MKKIFNYLSCLLIAVLTCLGLVIVFSYTNLPGNFKLFTVMSGSMEPTIKLGSLIIVKPAGSYQVGDIITYKIPEDLNNPRPKLTTTHRIFDIKLRENEPEFITKGDANDTPDSGPIKANLIIGRVFLILPYLGKIIAYSKTQTGFILVVIIPATLIVYSELINIKNEIIKIRSKTKKK